MDTSLISAGAALFGSLIGGLTTLATGWMTQRVGARTQRIHDEIAKRERLYSLFIDEASARVIDAIEHEISESRQVVKLFGLFCRIQLVCTQPVLAAARRVVNVTAELYQTPNMPLKQMLTAQNILEPGDDPLAAFSRACRDELEKLKQEL